MLIFNQSLQDNVDRLLQNMRQLLWCKKSESSIFWFWTKSASGFALLCLQRKFLDPNVALGKTNGKMAAFDY